jgi:hypothetical protein
VPPLLLEKDMTGRCMECSEMGMSGNVGVPIVEISHVRREVVFHSDIASEEIEIRR